jgi:hypothetical protein
MGRESGVASVNYVWYGVEVTLSSSELNTITGTMNGGASAATLTAAALVVWGITAPASLWLRLPRLSWAWARRRSGCATLPEEAL